MGSELEKIRCVCIQPYQMLRKYVFSKSFYHYQMKDNSIMGVNNGTELLRYKKLYFYLKQRFNQYDTQEVNLLGQLSYFMMFTLLLKGFKVFQNEENDFLFTFGNCKKPDRIAVYETRKFGTELYNHMSRTCNYNIVLDGLGQEVVFG